MSLVSTSGVMQEIMLTLKSLGKLEKEFPPVHAALQKLVLRETATPNREAAATSVAKISQRVKEIHTKAAALHSRLKSQCAQLATENCLEALSEVTFESTLRREIIDYLISRGYVSVASKCAAAFQLPIGWFPLLKELAEGSSHLSGLIRDLRERRDCASTLQWCETNREALASMNHNLLEVQLQILELLRLCSASAADTSGMERLQFIAAKLLPFAVYHPQLVQDATTCATHDPSENFMGMYDDAHWEVAISQLLHDYVAVCRAPREDHGNHDPTLVLRCTAGIVALRDLLPQGTRSQQVPSTPSSMAAKQLSVDATLTQLVQHVFGKESSTPNESKLSVKRQTRLFCRVTGKEIVNPMVLPNGTVISEEGLEVLKLEAQREGSTIPEGNVRCPRTQEVVVASGTRRMFIV